MRVQTPVCVIVGLVCLGAVAQAAGPRGHGFSSATFGQARAQSSCPQQAVCFDSAFQNTGSTTAWANCYDENLNIPHCVSDFRAGQSFNFDFWTGYHQPCVGDCFQPTTWLSVDGTREGDVFILEGDAGVVEFGAMELAVLHYTGNPTALAGVVVNGVQDLIAQGIVSPAQILYSETFTVPGEIDISEAIPVSGIPTVDIVIYGYGETSIPPGEKDVPAMSTTALVVLTLLMLAAFGCTFRVRIS